MVFLLVLSLFLRFSLIREYANEIIYISGHRKKGMCLRFYVVPYLLLYDKQHSRYDCFCRCTLILEYHISVCGTVSSMLSGLKTRSLGLNTLGTTSSPASSQSVQVGRPSTASWVQPVLSKVNVTCSRSQRNVHRSGFEPGTPWSEIRRPNHCATPPP